MQKRIKEGLSSGSFTSVFGLEGLYLNSPKCTFITEERKINIG
jgi:hypothetical protein